MINLPRTLQAAFVLFTRLPLASAKLQAPHFQQAHYFLPVIGAVVGLLMALMYQLSHACLSSGTAVIIALISGILLTGALHEDGFADCCDGFGGGNSREKIIEIMKDSRLGTFGVLGLIGLMALKITLFHDIPASRHFSALLTISVVARIAPLLLMAFLPYIQNSASKMTGQMQIRLLPLAISTLTALAGMAFFHPWPLIAGLALTVLSLALIGQLYLAQRLQGYNGDCLGACEQIAECAVLFLMAIYY